MSTDLSRLAGLSDTLGPCACRAEEPCRAAPGISDPGCKLCRVWAQTGGRCVAVLAAEEEDRVEAARCYSCAGRGWYETQHGRIGCGCPAGDGFYLSGEPVDPCAGALRGKR